MEIYNLDKMIYGDEYIEEQLIPILPPWDTNNFRWFIFGETGSGKSQLLLNILMNGMIYDKIYLYTLDDQEKTYMAFEKWISRREDEVNEIRISADLKPTQIYYPYYNIDDFPEATDLEQDSSIEGGLRNVIVFDDWITLGKDGLRKIKDYLIMSRKRGCAVFLLSQTFFGAPKLIRSQCNIFTVFPNCSDSEFSNLRRHVLSSIDIKVWKKIVRYCKANDGFLHIDNKTKDRRARCWFKLKKRFKIQDFNEGDFTSSDEDDFIALK